MPQAAAYWVASYFVYAGTAAYTIAFVTTYVVATLAITVGLSKISSALMGKPKGVSGSESRKHVVRDSTHGRAILYGEGITSGVLAYINTTGTKNEYIDFVIVLAGHQITEISDVYFDANKIPFAAINSGAAAGGSVGTYTQDGKPGKYQPRDIEGISVPNAYIYKYLGTDTQAASSVLASAYQEEWSSNHRLLGCAYVHVRLRRDSDAYANGAPNNFRFGYKGAKVYDPRLDSTNGGAGAHRVDVPSTWAHSANAALCTADYLIGGAITNSASRVNMRGFGAAPADVDWPTVIATANICDELVTVPVAATQARYRCDGVLSMSEATSENLELLLTSMMGQLVYSSGLYRMFAGVYDAPALTLNETDLASGLSFITGTSRGERFNAVRGTRWDRVNGTEVEFLPRTDPAYEADDGGRRLYRDIQLPFTDDEYRAQRIAQLILRRSREQQTLVWRGNLGCLRVGVWETVAVTVAELGISNKTFRCLSRTVSSEDAGHVVELTLREEFVNTYADPIEADYGDLTPSNPQPVAGGALYPPVAFTTTSVAGGIQFNITPHPSTDTGVLYDIAQYSGGTPVASATTIWSGAVTAVSIPFADQVTRYYWVRTRRNAIVSDWFPVGNGTPGIALAAGAGPAGEAGISIQLTRPHASIMAYADGTVLSLATANGYFYLYLGADQVATASVVYSVVSHVGCTGTIAANGYYSVTAMSANEATLVLRAVYAGKTYEAWFTLSKILAGIEVVALLPTTNLFNGRTVYLNTNGKLYRYSTVNSPIGWTSMVPATDITGTLVAAQLAAGSVTVAKFASGITPIEIVGTLPVSGNYAGRMVFLTTDKKVYRYDVTLAQFTKEVDGGDIKADSITAGQIAAGAIGADEIAANSITAGKLRVGAAGAALNADPNLTDATAWTVGGNGLVFATVADGKVGNTVARTTGAGVQGNALGAAFVPFDPSKTYRVRCWIRAVSGAASYAYMGVALNDAAGVNIAGAGTYWYYAASGVLPPSTWTQYVGEFGAGTAKPFPANGRTMTPLFILSYAGGTSVHEVQDVRIEEQVPSTLIADGAITTNHIAANTITAGMIQSNVINSDHIAANTIYGNKIITGSLTAAQMATNTITAVSGVLADACITTAKITDLSVDTIKITNGAVTASVSVVVDRAGGTHPQPAGTAGTFTDMPGAVITVTGIPTTGSRVVVAMSSVVAASSFENPSLVEWRLKRNDNLILTGPAVDLPGWTSPGGDSTMVVSWNFVDNTPSTVYRTYQLQATNWDQGVAVNNFGRWYETQLLATVLKR